MSKTPLRALGAHSAPWSAQRCSVARHCLLFLVLLPVLGLGLVLVLLLALVLVMLMVLLAVKAAAPQHSVPMAPGARPARGD